MVCYLTSKRMTYFLIIRQLRFDRYDFVASELERLFFNSLGNLDLSNLPPSDELQRIVGSNSICSELLSNAQSSLEILLKNAAPDKNLLRRPKSMLSLVDNAFVVSQDDVSSPVTIFADSGTIIDTIPDSSESSTNQMLEEDSVSQVLTVKRGRAVSAKSLSSSSSSINCTQEEATCTSETHQTGEILNELQKISQELRKEDKLPEEKSTINSFLSISNPNTVEQSKICVDENDDSDFTQVEPNPVETLLQPVISDNYTKYKIVKIDDDEAIDASLEPDSEVTFEIDTPKSGPSLTKDAHPSSQKLTESKDSQRSKFSQYGRPEDFANCPKETPSSSGKTLPKRDFSNTDSNPYLSGHHKPVQSNYVDSCSSKRTPAHRLSDNTELLQFDNSSKLKVLNILFEGWTVHVAFEKRVRKEIPRAGKSSLEEILYAVFGYEASTFVEFKTTEKNRLHIRLNPAYKAEHFETILATIDPGM